MADLNVTYHATKPQYDIQAIKVEVLYDFLPENVKSNVDKFIANITDINNQQATTESAIKVPYQGSTSDDRNKWIADRIEAVYKRLDLIRADAEGNKEMIVELGGQPSPEAFQIIGAVLSIIPATRPVGVVTSTIGKFVNRSNNNEAYRQNKINEANFRISGYARDVDQLNAILKQLNTEYAGTPNTKNTLYNSGKPIPVWYYYVGAAVIILLLAYAKNRREGR